MCEQMEFMQLDRGIYYRTQVGDPCMQQHSPQMSLRYLVFSKNIDLAFIWGGLGTKCTAMAGTKQINASPPRHLKMWM